MIAQDKSGALRGMGGLKSVLGALLDGRERQTAAFGSWKQDPFQGMGAIVLFGRHSPQHGTRRKGASISRKESLRTFVLVI